MHTDIVEYKKADAKYYSIRHASGITVYYYPMAGKSKSAAMIATKFGSINREFKKYRSDEWMTVPDGIAHFLEHKLFEGEKGNAFDYYARTGAKANAYTSNDRTAYYFVATEKFYESLEILLRFIKHPYFTPENVEKEKGIIGQEIRMYDDEPSWQGYISLVQSLYHHNPVRVDIAGTVETIADITDRTLYDCYDVFYNNANLTLCIAGDLDIDKILQVCDRQLPFEQSDTILQKFPTEPEGILREYSEKEMDVSKLQFFIGIKDNEAQGQGDKWAKHALCVKILIAVMFGESSEFFSELYLDGVLNPEFSVDYESGVGFGFLLFAGESDAPETVVEKIRQICRDFSADMIDENKFRRARNFLYGAMIRSLDSAESVVNKFVACRLMEGDIFTQLRVLENITPQDIAETAQKLLDESKISLSVIKPKRK